MIQKSPYSKGVLTGLQKPLLIHKARIIKTQCVYLSKGKAALSLDFSQ